MVPSMQIMSGCSRPMAAKAALRPAHILARAAVLGGFAQAALAGLDMGLDARHRVGDFGLHAIGVDDQDGFGIGGIAGRVIGFHRADASGGP